MSKSMLRRLKAQEVDSVTVQCIGCKATREIKAHEIEPADVPICPQCYQPMMPIRAQKGHPHA